MKENSAAAAAPLNKIKRQWRVGTFSMGTTLMVFGLVLLLSQFKNFSGVELVSTWWPAVMIILGLEILAAIYFSGEENPPIKYDIFSIFMVLLIGGAALGMYALSSVGVVPALAESVTSRTFSVDVPEQRFALKEGIRNIVVNASEFNSNISRINIREADGNEVVAFARATVPANSLNEAKAMLPESLVTSHMVGDTLFLDFETIPSGNQFQERPHVDHTIVLPRGRKVQIEADNGSPLKLTVNDLENSWAVNSPGRVEVTVASQADIKVQAFARKLGGEVKWTSLTTGNPGVKNPDGSLSFDRTAEGEFIEAKGKGSVTFGKGNHKLEINGDEVFVNDI